MLASLDTSDTIALGAGIVAALAFGVAVWSVLVARGANKLSGESNEVARRALAHTERQTELAERVEQERARLASARAVMEADMSPLLYMSEGSSGNFRPLLRIRNVGDRDSGRTTVRVYMVAGQDMMAWDDEQTRHDRTRPITDPDLTLHHPATQAPLPVQYIERVIDNVTTTHACRDASRHPDGDPWFRRTEQAAGARRRPCGTRRRDVRVDGLHADRARPALVQLRWSRP